MDLMTLAAKLTLDDSGFQSGVRAAGNAGEALGNKISAVTVAVGNIVADMVKKAVASITGVINGAIDGFADYQQLIGGVETLFKGSADKVSGYAKNAYKTAGMSANQYMETVTSFSASLLQGLGGDTEQAAEIANLAIQDMADNANKMGTDLASIQTAYAGFAKQNYTMLDNLKLGYGGTESEMIRLVNDSHILDHEITSLDEITFDQLILAIHAVQTEMGITGTTAEEASETISGSAASMKAAWEDMLSAVGGEGDRGRLDEAVENFKSSFGIYMENFIPALVTTIMNSGTLVDAIAEAITNLPTDLLTRLAEGGLSAGAEMIGALGDVVGWLIDSLVEVFKTASIDSSKVAQFGEAIGQFIGNTVANLVTNLPALVEGMFNIGITLAGNIIKGIWEGLFGSESDNRLKEINQQLTDTITEAEVSSSRAQGILNYMEEIYRKYGEAAKETAEWQHAEDELEKVLGGSKDVFDQYGSNVQGAIDKLKDMTEELRRLAITQAMQDKLTAQFKLLGEYEGQRLTAEAEIAYAESEMEAIDKRRAESAKAYAQALMTGGWLEEGSSAWWTAKNTLETPGYAGTGLSELVSALEDMYEWNGTSEEDKVWNMSQFDDILSPETLNGLDNAYETNRKTIETATDTIETAQESINQTNREIQITMTAMANMEAELKELDGSSVEAARSIELLSNAASSAVASGIMAAISPGISFMPRAVGLDYAPNGFRAELHQGEAILTREENEARRGGYSDDFETRLEDAVERAFARIYINMDGRKVADLTTRRTEKNISGSEHTRVWSMGG